jgi:tripartite-type tricarboxylate transporter receptor subunit TctC
VLLRSLCSHTRRPPRPRTPTKPIRFLVGFPPGGTNDIVARVIAPKLGENLGQQVIVDNRGGANTAIGTEIAARAVPDGYTILLNAPGHATNPGADETLVRFDPGFRIHTLIAEAQNLLVAHPSLPGAQREGADRPFEKNPGQINYGSSGTGTTVHLSAALFEYMTV